MAHAHLTRKERTAQTCVTLNNTGGLYRERTTALPKDCTDAINYFARKVVHAQCKAEITTALFNLSCDLRALKNDDPRFVRNMADGRTLARIYAARLTS